ncbi:hypothetical protein SNE40_022941 [Patella caerulea]|uniref:Myosin light chain kinase, smooth muscle n=1 Tax=Patella caerulea TaxID=87958 RepID=A0AAN8G6B8_PATCE
MNAQEDAKKTYTSTVVFRIGVSDKTRVESSHSLKPVELKVDLKNGIVEEEELEVKTVTQPVAEIKPIVKDVAPDFIIKPRRQLVDEGESTKFKASFEGSPNTQVIWSKNGKEITPDAHYKVYAKDDFHFLEVVDVLPEHGGSYTCVLQNPAGSKTTSVDLEVFEKPKPVKVAPPTLLKPLKDQSVALGERDVKFQCTVSGAATGDVTWFKDGKELRQGRQYKLRYDGSMAFLGLTTATQADCGLYECVIKNKGGEVRTSCTLNVENEKREPPYFVRELEDMEVDDGDKVELVVEVKGSEPINVFWIHNNKEIARDDMDYQQTSVSKNVFKLTIAKSVPGDAGAFVCEAYNEFGDTDTFCNVSIREIEKSQPPDFIIKPKLTKVTEGESAMFTCRVVGIPLPNVYWERNGKILRSQDRYQISQNHDKHTLVITKTTKDDAGKYVCRLDNQMVSIVHSTSLIVQEKSPVTTDFRSVLKKRSSLGNIGKQSSTDSEKSDKENDRRVFHTILNRMDDSSLNIKKVAKESHSALRNRFEENSTKDCRVAPVSNAIKSVQNSSSAPRATAEVKPFLSNVLAQTKNSFQSKMDTFQKSTLDSEAKISETNKLVMRPLPRALDVKLKNGSNVEKLSVLKTNGTTSGFLEPKRESSLKPRQLAKQIEIDKQWDLKTSKPQQIDFRNVLKSKDHDKKINQQTNGLTSLEKDKKSTEIHNYRSVLTSRDTVKKSVEMKDGIKKSSEIYDFRKVLISKDPSPKESVETKVKTNYSVQHDFRSVLSNKTEKPQFVKNLSDKRVKYGGEAVLACKIEGMPAPEIKWQINEKEIKPSRYFQLKFEHSVASLTISEAFSEDEGEYVVTASNSAGISQSTCQLTIDESSSRSSRSDSRSIEGAVSFPAKILTVTPVNVSAIKGKSTEIKAAFTGEPPPSIRWYKYKHELESDGRIHIKTLTNSSVLSINNLQQSDVGKYSIVAENELGCDSATISVSVQELPYCPMGRPYVSDITKSSVSLTWYGPAYDGGSPITAYCVELCKGNSRKWQTVTNSCRNTFYQVDTLEANTQYVFRVRAANKHGISEPGEQSELILTFDNQESDYESDDELPFEPRNVTIDINRKFEDYFETLEEIGRGKFGNVYKCRDKKTNEIWAAKILKCRDKEKPNIRNEIDVMNKLIHPKVLMLWDAFEAPRTMVLVMEYIRGGELFERVISDDFELTERDVIHFMRQICDGVGYMHKESIIHLDLKPENILCISNSTNQIKIIDFGLAQHFKPGQSVKVLFGTPEFIAPEVVNYDEISFSTDMWSVGVICYVLLSGLSPFSGDTEHETLSNVTLGEFDFDDDAFTDISDNAKDFIQNLLIKNKSKRFTIDQCKSHPWLAQDEKRIRCKRLNTEKLKHFMARRKWQTSISSPLSNDDEVSFTYDDLQKSSPNNQTSPTNVQSTPLTTEPMITKAIPRFNLETKLTESSPEKKSTLSNNNNSIYKDNTRAIDNPCDNPDNDGSFGFRVNNVSLRREQSDYSSSATPIIPKRETASLQKNLEKLDLNKSDSDPTLKPSFVKEMVDCEAFSGDVIRFDVVVSKDTTIHWYYEDEKIIEDSRHIIDFGENGRCSLIIRQVTEDDEGEYTCAALNENGETTCSAELIVCGSGAF